jgi:hypothetical protein
MPELTPAKIIGLALIVIFCVVELFVPTGGKLDGLIRGKVVGFLVILAALSVVRAVYSARRAKQMRVEEPE